MKKIQLLVPILIMFIMLIISIVGFAVFAPNNLVSTNRYEYFAFLGSFVGGILTPFVSVFGFIYIFISFLKENNQNRIGNMINLIDKYENNLKVLLSTKYYFQIEADKEPLEFTFERAIKLERKNRYDDFFYYNSDCRSKTKLISEMVNLYSYLYYMAIYSEKLKRYEDYSEIMEFYRTNYRYLANYINDNKLIIANNIITHGFKDEIKSMIEKYYKKIEAFYIENNNNKSAA